MTSNHKIKLILGTAQLVSSYGVTRKTDQTRTATEAIQMLAAASDMGFQIIDTAPAYGSAEEVIGAAPVTFSVHTKLRSELSARESLLASKGNLKTESIDVMYIHDLEAFRRKPVEMMQDLSGLLDLGVKEIGVSIYEPEDWNLVKKFKDVTVVQVPMNIFDRRFSGQILDEFQSAGVSCIVRSAFLQGILLAEIDELRPEVNHLRPYLQRLREITSQAKLDSVSACLNWLASQVGISGIIVGVQTEDELRSIMQSWEKITVSNQDISWSDEIELPSWEMIDPRNWAK
jgi:aryl-alcohol dehydrogenase-like predicted oxidoreductase